MLRSGVASRSRAPSSHASPILQQPRTAPRTSGSPALGATHDGDRRATTPAAATPSGAGRLAGGDARRAKSAGPLGAPTGRSAIISPEATSTGRSAPRVEIFSVDPRPFCRADKSADFFAAPAPRAVSFGPRAGRGADRSHLSRFSRACPRRRVLVDFWPEARDSPN